MRWLAPLPNQGSAASVFYTSSPVSVLSASARSSRNRCRQRARMFLDHSFRRPRGHSSQDICHGVDYYQCTVPLAPGPPGVNFPSSDSFSPGTAASDVAVGEFESPLIDSWEDAHADRSDPINRNRTARNATRSFTRRTYVCICLMQAAVSDRFCSEEHRKNRHQVSRF